MNIFSKIAAGLKKTKDSMMGKLEALMNSFTKIDEEFFEELERDIEDTVRRIADEMRSGDAAAEPLVYGKTDPCTYCDMKPICRYLPENNERRE